MDLRFGRLVVGALVASCALTTGAEEAMHEAPVRVERVALFKNGLAFVASGARLPGGAHSVRFGQLPVPSFGTFWVGYPEEVRVRSLVASLEEVAEEQPVHDLRQLLQANTGRRVWLWFGTQETDVLSGLLLEAPGVPTATPELSPYFMGARRPSDARPGYPVVTGPGHLLLQTDGGRTVALNAASVTRAEFEGETRRKLTVKRKRPSLRLELDAPAPSAPVAITCLARGLTWAPSYLIDLSDPEMARFSARALVVNELTDLEGVQLELVTGFPNIRFGEVVSPLALSQSLADFLGALAGGGPDVARGGHNVLGQQAVMSNLASYGAFEETPVPSYSTAMEGAVAEDLFLYPVEDFSLGQGETAWVPLFSADMPYEHIYTWHVPDALDESGRYPGRDDRTEETEEVWHSCRLRNTLEMPLTTAAAEFVKDGRFTGQDICHYTPPNSRTTIRINRAMNVLARQAEVELERTRNAAKFYGYSYDRVKVGGELRLQSRLDEVVKLEVTKELSGDVVLSQPGAEDVKTAKGLEQVNPKHRLTWTLELAPREELKLVYEYLVYVRG